MIVIVTILSTHTLKIRRTQSGGTYNARVMGFRIQKQLRSMEGVGFEHMSGSYGYITFKDI
ncbi:MAG: hypothetical protein R3321_12515, partial [Nitrososphaeraceae archaeon]|nr:hypothetical protein [Nitrososphaeraceae archaeon]